MFLHLFREGAELVAKARENLPLACDKVGDVAVGAEVADDDDGIVRQHELFRSVLVSPVEESREDGVAVATEHGLDDIGADGGGGVVVGGSFHLFWVLITLQR